MVIKMKVALLIFLYQIDGGIPVQVSHYAGQPTIHASKNSHYLPMRENEFYNLLTISKQVLGKTKQCKKHYEVIEHKPMHVDNEPEFTSVLK